jgi:adenylate cyclase
MTDREFHRRLVAVLAADVAGYTRAMEDDSDGTVTAWRAARIDVIDPCIAEHNGRIVKHTGDGFLAEYSSVRDAVECALAMQKGLSKCPLRFRMGLHLGDVVDDGGDIHGEGVNVAARLESIAEPGSVCVSAVIYRLIGKKVAADVEDIGLQELKNIAEPVRAFQLRPAMSGTRKVLGQRATSKRPAVAVLPFVNMGGDPEQEYFSDGLTEDLIGALSRWRSIPIIARNSTFTYKGKAVRFDKIADELGVRYVVQGSIRKSGNRLRVTAQFIDAETGHHIWADKFDRQLEDIFDLQDEISTRIAAILIPELEHFELKRSAVKPTEDLNAWDFYLRGMDRFYDETCDSNAVCLEMFRRAVDLDPNYSDAWARLGWSHARQVMYDCTNDREETLRRGFEAGRRAVALDDGSSLAHIALGTVHIFAEETELGLAAALRALDLNPNFTHAAMAVGNRLDLVGRTEEGIAQIENALTLNPRDPNRWRYMAYLSRAYISAKDYERPSTGRKRP